VGSLASSAHKRENRVDEIAFATMGWMADFLKGDSDVGQYMCGFVAHRENIANRE
jgi:hypothetical protein